MSAVPILTFAYCVGDSQCDRMGKLLPEIVRANRSTGLTLEAVDVDSDGARARRLSVMEYPTVLLHVDGAERARVVGLQSRRALLHALLPALYPSNDDALEQLRRQLGNAGEHFPRRTLKRNERLGKAARVTMLSHVPLFASLPRKQVARIAQVCDEIVLDEGAALMHEGDDGDACYVVASGSLNVRRRSRKVAGLGPGDVVGEMALLDGGPRAATVTADERCVLLALDRPTFMAALERAPDVAIALLAVLSGRLRQAQASPID